MVEKIFTVLIKQILGRTLLGNWEDPWAVAIHIIAMIATIFWMYRIHPEIAPSLGKAVGGLAIGMLKLTILISIAITIIHMVINFGVDSIGSGVSHVPAIGEPVARFFRWAAKGILAIIIPILIGWYVLKNIVSVGERAGDVIKNSAKDSRDEHGNVKKSYSFAAIFILSGLINRPEINEVIGSALDGVLDGWTKTTLTYSVNGINVALGAFCLVFRTQAGRDKVENAEARALGEPRERDGAWKCIKTTEEPVVINGKTIMEGGKPKIIKKHCPGPRGPKPDGTGDYGGWNPKELPCCMRCRHPNPVWQKCHTQLGGCGYAGEDGEGFRRKAKQPVTCPKCMKVWPAITNSTPSWGPSSAPQTSQPPPQPGQGQVPQAPQAPQGPYPPHTAPPTSSGERPAWFVATEQEAQNATSCWCCGKPAPPFGFCGYCGANQLKLAEDQPEAQAAQATEPLPSAPPKGEDWLI